MISFLLSFSVLELKTNIRYKFKVLSDIIQILFNLSIFFFLSESIGKIKFLQGEYFPFVILGLLYSKLYQTMVFSSSSHLIDFQYQGLIDTIFISPRSRFKIFFSMGLSDILKESLIFIAIVAVVKVIFIKKYFLSINFPLFVFSVTLSFIWTQILSLINISSILLWKRVNIINLGSNMIMTLLGGVYFPIDILPPWMQKFSTLLPFTNFMSILRSSFGIQATSIDTTYSIKVLITYTLLMAIIAFIFYKISFKKILMNGKLNNI